MGEFHMDYEFLKNSCKTSRRGIDKCFNNLVKNQFLIFECLYDEEIISHLKNKTPTLIKNKINHLYECSWCLSQSYVIHAHHHPIRKCNGGIQTIKICANCHFEFHYLSERKVYKIPDGDLEEVKKYRTSYFKGVCHE
jgi:hypothetical protein